METEPVVHILWMNGGLSCDGDSVALTAATQPTIEEIVLGALPGQPMTTSEWLDRLAPKATAVLAVGTCATCGGIHAMAGNPTGAMGVPDYLGWDWKSKAGLPIVCVPGVPRVAGHAGGGAVDVSRLWFDVRLHGAGLDGVDEHLDPVPLLSDGAGPRVAVPS